jgi:hypothetical protein
MPSAQTWVQRLALLLVVGIALTAAARPTAPDKIPVSFGSWTGPSARTFKSALRHGLRKDCTVVGAKTARVIIDGVVSEQGKGVVVRVTVKSPKDGEIIESREFPFSKPTPSQSQGDRMGAAVVDMARRAPTQP